MIRAFPAGPSVVPGDDVVLHVCTGAPAFRADFYRWGRSMELVGRSDWRPGRHLPDHLPYQDWAEHGVGLGGEDLEGWPAHHFAVPAGWRPGVYVAALVEGDGEGRADPYPAAGAPDARSGRALFVVTNPAPGTRGSILYKIPLLTYHAYNCASHRGYEPGRVGWSLYTVPEEGRLPSPVPPAVSLRRPGGGTGGFPSDLANVDPFDPTPRQTFAHWDAPFVRWLEANGYGVDYCTDLDLHADVDGRDLGRYRLMVSAGHDEYWTDAMRDTTERFVRGGGNVAFFGGNTCWWRVTFDDGCSFRRVAEWSDPKGPDRPENTLTGVSFRNGGERDGNDHPVPVGFEVQHADHWVYEGTGLGDGDRFGHRPGEYLVGYECDGASFDRSARARGRAASPSGDDGTPGGFAILGIGDAVPSGWGMGNGAATLGVHTPGGTVFTAATTDWARLLGGGHEAVSRITANVVDRLS